MLCRAGRAFGAAAPRTKSLVPVSAAGPAPRFTPVFAQMTTVSDAQEVGVLIVYRWRRIWVVCRIGPRPLPFRLLRNATGRVSTVAQGTTAPFLSRTDPASRDQWRGHCHSQQTQGAERPEHQHGDPAAGPLPRLGRLAIRQLHHLEGDWRKGRKCWGVGVVYEYVLH